MSTPSKACCSIPPVISKGYEGKGKYETIGDTKTYVTGPANSSKAVFFVADIFGYFPQTVQGADILATSDKENQYQVFVPDFFDGKPADISWYPPDNKEKEEKLNNFFGTTGAPPKAAEKIPGLVKAISEKYPSIKTWAIIGFCWGGKVVSMAISSNPTLFKAGAEAHPAMVDPSDGEGIKIPFAILASKDEPADDIKKKGDNLTGPKHVETFSDQIHGWMGARGNLEDKRVKEEYERGYCTVIEFFAKHLGRNSTSPAATKL